MGRFTYIPESRTGFSLADKTSMTENFNANIKVSNYKVSFKLHHGIIKPNLNSEYPSLNIIKYKNFLVIKDNFSYIIFNKAKKDETNVRHVNITKLRSYSDIGKSVIHFQNFLIEGVVKQFVIDNITASADLKKKINLHHAYIKLKQTQKVRYCLEKFPALFVYLRDSDRVLIFSSGKLCFVGYKSLKRLEEAYEVCQNELSTH